MPEEFYTQIICTVSGGFTGTASIYSEPSTYVGCCEYDPDVVQPEIPGGDILNPGFTFPEADTGTDEEVCTNSGGYYVVGEDGVGICYGCTQYGNENYVAAATVDCGDAPANIGVCVEDGGNCLCCKASNTDTTSSCSDILACNYNPNAEISCLDNECCDYSSCYCCGDPNAANYNNLIFTDDFTADQSGYNNYQLTGSELEDTCSYFVYTTEEGCSFSGPVDAQAGCMDPQANNYDPSATEPCPEGTCDDYIDNSWCQCCSYSSTVYDPDPDGDVDHEEEDIIFDVQCNEFPDLCGCTDVTMFNYDLSAEFDDGSCVPFIEGCIDPNSL